MINASPAEYDVAIIGGGPGGSTVAGMIKKYAPETSVVVLEKERFPRDHVGESQLPPIGDILEELGCWGEVEAANFPIKVGATFRWGKSDELWDFEFLPLGDFKDEPRPAKYEGQRRQTAFQVDRAVYDDILLRHAEGLGAEVREETPVASVMVDGDRVTGLELRDRSVVTARHYVDASGHLGVMRRALGVGTEIPTRLQNIAMWDYWDNAEWAVEIGVGGTRVQVLSLEHGWIWFIPLGPTRTSIGLICPAEYYKSCKQSPEEMYIEAIEREPRVAALTRNATRRGEVETTTDWSFVADRCAGENWFLVGEAAGFADPVLAASMTLAHTGARELA
jgi:flavin-dependent dehydrogenase